MVIDDAANGRECRGSRRGVPPCGLVPRMMTPAPRFPCSPFRKAWGVAGRQERVGERLFDWTEPPIAPKMVAHVANYRRVNLRLVVGGAAPRDAILTNGKPPDGVENE